MEQADARSRTIIGWFLSGFVILFLLADALFQLVGHILGAAAIEQTLKESGFSPDTVWITGGGCLLAVILYAIPRTAVLGAILATGYLGGAIAVAVAEHGIFAPPQGISTLLGVMAWGGLYLRRPALRAAILQK